MLHVLVQVSKWRHEKQQLLAAQAKQEAALQLESQHKREEEEEKKKQKQGRTKLKVSAYREERADTRAEQEKWLESLKEETERLRQEKLVAGEGRVQYRRAQHQSKLHRQQERLAEREEEERERERQLEALRQQVRGRLLACYDGCNSNANTGQSPRH